MSRVIREGLSVSHGPLVRVEVGLTAPDRRRRHRLGEPIPQPVEYMALIDTGAQETCATPAALGPLALPLKAARFTNAPGVAGMTPTLIREVRLTILHPSGDPARCLVVPVLQVTELDIDTLGYDLLIGRDVLSLCRLVYDGPRDRFTLAY